MSHQVVIPHKGSLSAGLAAWLAETGNTPLLEKRNGLCKGRNILMERFLSETSADWLVYLDDDNWPASEGLIEFATRGDYPFVGLPYLFTNWRWSFGLREEDQMRWWSTYKPGGEYSFAPAWLVGGGGICLHRETVKALPQPIWQEAPTDLPPEDVLFSYTLTKKLGVPCATVWGGALHHDKGGFDLLNLVCIQ